VRTQKLIWCNIMKSIKSKKILVLYYNIDWFDLKKKIYICINILRRGKIKEGKNIVARVN
jgi:hypothetical protein